MRGERRCGDLCCAAGGGWCGARSIGEDDLGLGLNGRVDMRVAVSRFCALLTERFNQVRVSRLGWVNRASIDYREPRALSLYRHT